MNFEELSNKIISKKALYSDPESIKQGIINVKSMILKQKNSLHIKKCRKNALANLEAIGINIFKLYKLYYFKPHNLNLNCLGMDFLRYEGDLSIKIVFS